MKHFQTTLKKELSFHGYGVHSGQACSLTIRPAAVDHGVVFVRYDDKGKKHSFPAQSAYICSTELCTALGHGAVRVETIEHLMAAVGAFRLDNLEIELDTNEVPILDGSAKVYVDSFLLAGIAVQTQQRHYLRILKPIKVTGPHGFAEFLPYDGTRFDVTIDFSSPVIGKQSFVFDLDVDAFVKEIASARTFGFLKDAEALWAKGIALGSSLDNSIVIGDDDKILNTTGLRYEDEFVRHKLLDVIGDTALLGKSFIGQFRSLRSGHKLNAACVKKLLATSGSYDIVHFSEGKWVTSGVL